MERFVKLKRMRANAHEPFKLNRDLLRYRKGYPGESLNKQSLNRNVRFYKNQIKSEPRGEYIDTIHEKWAADYHELEVNHGYIQWLFPIHEEGVNSCAQVLQRHEAEVMRKDPAIRARIKRSYSMMLAFYGAEVLDWETGELARTGDFAERFKNLNRKWHNFLRITRILKFLGEMNFEHLKLPFLTFFAREALVHQTLPSIVDSLHNYWAGTLKDDEELKCFLSLLHDPSRLQAPARKSAAKKEAAAKDTPSMCGQSVATAEAKTEQPKDEEDSGEEASESQEQSLATTVAADEEELDPDSVALSPTE